MVEGSIATRKRDYGFIMKMLFGEDRYQRTFRCLLLFFIVYLFYKNSYPTAITGILLYLFLCFCFYMDKIDKINKINIVNKLKKMFFSNSMQRSFMDIFFILLWMAIIFPLQDSNFLLNFIKELGDLVLLLNQRYELMAKFADSKTFHFILWDIIAIVMSFILSHQYEDEFFSTIDEVKNINNFSSEVKNMSYSSRLSRILMVLSIIFFLFKIYFCALILLVIVAGIFIQNDRWLLKIFKGLTKNSKIDIRIKQTTESLCFANIPALVGLIILSCVAGIFEYGNLPLHKSDGTSLSAFIAGGSAMHMVLGNFIVLICMRKDQEA